MKLEQAQVVALVRLVETTPWGDIAVSLDTIEHALTLGMAATTRPFLLWEAEAESEGFPDEFSVSEAHVAAMSERWLLAYLARLLRTVALMVGIGTEFGGKVGNRRDDRDALAPLLRHLYQIVDGSGM